MSKEDTVVDKARYLAIGMTAGAASVAWRSARRLARTATGVGKAGLAVVKPVTDSELFKPVRETLDAVATRQQERLEEMVKVGRHEEGRVWRLALTVVDIPIDEIITYLDGNQAVRTLIRHAVEDLLPELGDHPAVQDLVRQQAGQYLTYLVTAPDQVQELIRSQAGEYLAHLQANPDQVQELIRGQVGNYVVYLQENPDQIQELIRTQVSLFLDYLVDNSDQVQTLIRSQAGEYLKYLEASSTEVDALVEQVAGNYLAYLQAHPEALDPFVQAQTQRILDHLSENPEQVQSLVQGQSLTMASQMRDEVRSGTVTADTAVEMVVRSLFRRAPRTELPAPPPGVRARADNPRGTKGSDNHD